jgi:hypothetical protein
LGVLGGILSEIYPSTYYKNKGPYKVRRLFPHNFQKCYFGNALQRNFGQESLRKNRSKIL